MYKSYAQKYIIKKDYLYMAGVVVDILLRGVAVLQDVVVVSKQAKIFSKKP